MKTAFALAILAAGAQAGTMGTVTAEWKTTNHITDNALQICATHTTVVANTGTITYNYGGATCTAASKTATTVDELLWKSASDATTPTALKAVCVIHDTKVVCTGTASDGIAVAATEQSCVKLLKCRPTAQSAAATDFKVTSSADATANQPSAAVTFAANAIAALTVTKPVAANAVVGAAEFDLTLAIDPAAAIVATKVVSVLAPGYTQAVGGTCKFGTATASAATTAAQVDGWTFTVAAGGDSIADATTLVCTKVKVSATAAKAADKFAVIVGNSATATTEAKWVASPAITKKSDTASASTVSLSAAAVLLVASLYL